MKFLVIYREDTTMSAQLPPPVLMPMVEATGHWMIELKGSGKVTETAFLNPSHGGMAVFDVKDPGELLELVESCPVRPICTVETHPLIDAKEWLPLFAKVHQRAIASFEKMAAAMPKK